MNKISEKFTPIIIVTCLIMLAGCASIPPEAVTHVIELQGYHLKTKNGTLALFDASVDNTKFVVEQWETRDTEHISNTSYNLNEAIGYFQMSIHSLSILVEKIETLSALSDAQAKKNKKTEINNYIETQVQRLNGQVDDYEAALVQNEAVKAEAKKSFQEYKSDMDTARARLRNIIASHNDTINANLERIGRLLESYVDAQTQMQKVFGKEIMNKTTSLAQEVSDLTNKYDDLIEGIKLTTN